MNQGFWTAKGAGCLTDGEMGYNNSSRIEPKRSHQCFLDGAEAEFFPNKKQAVESPNNNLLSGMLNSNISPWGNASSLQAVSGHFTEPFFDSETSRVVNFEDRNIQSVGCEKLNMGRKVNQDPFGNDSSFGLSMSHTLDNPRSGLSYGGIRKVKVSQVKDSENAVPVSMGHAYSSGNNNTISMAHAYKKTDDNSMSMGLCYNKGDEYIISMGDMSGRKDNSFISMSQTYRGDDNASIGGTCKDSNNALPMVHALSKAESNNISIGQSYNKADDNTISMSVMYNKGDESTISMGNTYKGNNNNLSMVHSYSKGESTIISFGGYDDDDTNPPGRLISSYDLLMGQPSVEKDLVKSNADALGNSAQITAFGSETVLKKDEQKMTKKNPPNNFPSNVRSLLSTGMLDGVPVKYTAWSREKELRGVIRGSGYLCGCLSCNFSKVINAYEFEQHAGCKTKHPNNHIYFENGKTVYGIVQELRSTPQNMLFDIIQTITGSPINQKSFRLWKESFLAATRELQRIYGKDEGKQLS